MIAGWLAAFTFCTARNRPGWLPLAAVLAIVLVKRLYLFPTLIALLGAMVAVAMIRAWGMRRGGLNQPGRWRFAPSLVLWILWLTALWQSHAVAHRGAKLTLDPARPIACLGDSLTSGVAPHGGYPAELAKLLSIPVIDLGEAGITISQGEQRLAESANHRPQAVVIELGGHDFLKGADRATTRKRLQELIDQVRAQGAEPILVEIPRGFMTDPYAGLERELAHHNDFELVADTPIRKLVIWSPFAPPGMWMQSANYLSDDGLHPNAGGNRELARAVSEALAEVFGGEILRSPRLADSP
jgi:lysophospholipase L1-like esterase